MYHLLRIHLEGVGHVEARFDPLDLDFRSGNGSQAQATVLWLRNGGGKTSLLSLLFSLVQPRESDFLGRHSTRKSGGRAKSLEDYVLSSDVAHVVLEWGRPRGVTLPGMDGSVTLDRLVTGQVMAWRNQGKGSTFSRTFYAFRPQSDALEIESLPFRTDSRHRTPMKEYLAQIRAAGTANPRLEMVITETQESWRQYLEAVQLDPELFRSQLAMNEHEGGAEEFLDFRDGDTFVSFLLRLVTDPASVTGVRTNIDKIAELLIRKPDLERELEFVTGIDGHTPALLAARARLASAKLERESSERAARRLQEVMQGFAAGARQQVEIQTATASASAAKASRAETGVGRWAFYLTELEYRVAAHRVREAQEQLEAALLESAEANRIVDAWEISERQHERRQLRSRAEALRSALLLAEAGAAEQLHAYERAAARLRARLVADITVQDGFRTDAELDQSTASEQAVTQDAHAREAGERLAAIKAERKHMQRDVVRATAQRRELIGSGTLREHEPPNDAIERLRARLQELALREEHGTRDLESLAGEAAQLRKTAEKDQEKLSALLKQAAEADQKLSALTARMQGLASEPEVLELSGASALDVAGNAIQLEAALTERASEIEAVLLTEEADLSETKRALEALRATGLLPPGSDVEQALVTLRTAGVRAVAGSQYIAENVRVADREQVLDQHPELVDGVTVNDGELERAYAILERAQAPHRLLVLAESAAWAGAVACKLAAQHVRIIRNSPGHYDSAAAESERADYERRHVEGEDRSGKLRRAVRRHREILMRLQTLRDELPAAGLIAYERHLGRLQAQVEDLERSARRSGARLAEIDEVRTALAAEARAVARERAELRAHQERLFSFAALTEEAQAAEQALQALDQEQALVAAQRRDSEEEARAALARAENGRERAAAAQVAAVELRRALAGIGGVGPQDSPDDASATREQLEEQYRVTREAYELKTIRSEAARNLREAEERLSGLDRRLGTERAELVALADSLIDSPDWPVQSSRDAARRLARQAQSTAERTVGERERVLMEAERDLAGREAALPEKRIELPEDLPCETRVAAEGSSEKARLGLAEQRQSLERAHAEQRIANDLADAGRARAREADGLIKRLDDALAESNSAAVAGVELEPFEWESAPERVDAVVTALRQAAAAVREAADVLRQQISELRSFGQSAAFTKVPERLRAGYIQTDDELLCDTVASQSEEIAKRILSLRSEIDNIEGHRQSAAYELSQLVRGALATLDSVQRFKLPEGLGDWSGQQYVRIHYTRPDPSLLTGRLVGFVDELVHSPSRPGGVALLFKAVRAGIGAQPFEADVLKPNQDLPRIRESVASVASWSGGQKLTTALLLYCTLVRLRADNWTGRSGLPSSILMLDNPIGTANHVDFVDLQLRVAQKCHVQLVITTGIPDYDALAGYPNLIRLRNNRDSRSSLHYVNHAELEEAVPTEGLSWYGVKAARVYRRGELSTGDRV